jgi:hypothetical protein
MVSQKSARRNPRRASSAPRSTPARDQRLDIAPAEMQPTALAEANRVEATVLCSPPDSRDGHPERGRRFTRTNQLPFIRLCTHLTETARTARCRSLVVRASCGPVDTKNSRSGRTRAEPFEAASCRANPLQKPVCAS